MKALVTGASGFVGSHLIKLLLDKEYEVYGTYYNKSFEPDLNGRIHALSVNISDNESVSRLIQDIKPEEVYHLAGVAVTTNLETEPYYRVNFEGTVNLFRAVQKYTPETRVLYVGSANCYGTVEASDLPIKEDHRLQPTNHYAASKAAADLSACAFAADGLHVVRVRPFNHTGPGQTVDFVCSKLAKQVAEIACGKREPEIEAGSLETGRDFTDVRDVISAYILLLQRGTAGDVYNVCSGKAYLIKDIVAMLLESAGIEAVLKSKEGLKRKNDPSLLIGSCEKIFRDTGWQPKIPLKRTLRDMIDYWQNNIG